MSAIPSHSLSVFQHSISKPDPHVNSVPPPTPDLLNQSQPVLVVFQICNFLTHRFAYPRTMRRRNKHGPHSLFFFLFLLLPHNIPAPWSFAPCDFLPSISISFLLLSFNLCLCGSLVIPKAFLAWTVCASLRHPGKATKLRVRPRNNWPIPPR